jgi:hypothetical protein
MKHQIVLVGGQVLPLYLGIKEFSPDRIHFIVSKESKTRINLIKPLLHGKAFSELVCSPYDFNSIRSLCVSVIDKLGEEDEVAFNLTGGNKVMLLAAHSVMHDLQKVAFYINPDGSLLELPSYQRKSLTENISIQEFMTLSGHSSFASKTIGDFVKEDFRVAEEIEIFSNNSRNKFRAIIQGIRTQYKSRSLPDSGNITIANGTQLKWNRSSITATQNARKLFELSSPHASNLLFNGGWWELLVAREISKWPYAKELMIQCELKFKTDETEPKNEIDVLINLGRKLIFVECKSGDVKQEDINKMRVIRETYGGAISRSILVCQYIPKGTIIEKCRELDIEIFYCYPLGGKPLHKLTDALEVLRQRLVA